MASKFMILDGISGVPLGREVMEALQADGHAVIRFDCLEQSVRPLYKLRSACAKTMNKRESKDSFYLLPKLTIAMLAELIEREEPTHILVIGFIYKFFDPRDLRRLAKAGQAKLLLYDTDSCNLYDKRREFIFFVENELPIYDQIFSFSQVTTRFFRETRQLPASYLPYGANPVAVPENQDKCIDALFIGSGDLRRILVLEVIRDNVTIFGDRWQRNFPLISHELQARITDSPVWGKDLRLLLAQSKIVLNITRSDFYGAETGLNLRIFEAVAAGCFLLTDHCDELNELFEIGTEIDTFHTSGELAEKIRYYLEHEEERTRIAQRGHERFIRSHTWRMRIRELVQSLS